jgi:superfamily II DNA/RNA helicase
VRSAAQDAFIEDRARVMVATNAFGMGIDKPDIRFVIHAQCRAVSTRTIKRRAAQDATASPRAARGYSDGDRRRLRAGRDAQGDGDAHRIGPVERSHHWRGPRLEQGRLKRYRRSRRNTSWQALRGIFSTCTGRMTA